MEDKERGEQLRQGKKLTKENGGRGCNIQKGGKKRKGNEENQITVKQERERKREGRGRDGLIP